MLENLIAQSLRTNKSELFHIVLQQIPTGIMYLMGALDRHTYRYIGRYVRSTLDRVSTDASTDSPLNDTHGVIDEWFDF